MSIKDKPPVTSAVSNQAKAIAAAKKAAEDLGTVGTQNNVNPETGSGKGASTTPADDAPKKPTKTPSGKSTFTATPDPGVQPKPNPTPQPKQSIKRDLTKTKPNGNVPKPGAGGTGSGTTSTRGRGPRNVQRPSPGGVPKPKASLASFGKASDNLLSQFHRARGTFRSGIKGLVRSYSLKAVLKGIAKKAPRYLFRVFGGAIGVFLYALDSSVAAAGDYPWWYKQYRRALSEYLRSDEPAVQLNALRKMNVAVYLKQEKDTKAFIAVMTALGVVLNDNESKRASIMRQYQQLVKNYKKSLRAAGATLAKNTAEGERLYKETQIAYGWNQAYMQSINSYAYTYVKKFKKVSENYISLADRLRDDVVAASVDLR